MTDKVASLTTELLSIRVDLASHKTEWDEMTALVQRMKDDVEKALTDVFTEAQKAYGDTFDAVKLKTQADLVEGWKKLKTNFQVESVRVRGRRQRRAVTPVLGCAELPREKLRPFQKSLGQSVICE